ncbi:diguanylate cyclase [Pontibacillus yanchengensis]|uniref:Diguanylate cyclase n=1 Tax=Pontibacillus yanchengensis Y32 TaxID=1385514 RepID=A0A0A2TQT9_9BACI|nr:diguanylate cyclase [Pontibacillus yanchengensis]KGP71670.1 hypothetical protein N782_17610 [Pontibacillus yanchengensis Y32]
MLSYNYPFHLLLAAFITLFLGFFTIKYRKSPGAISFIFLMFLSSILAFANIYEIIQTSLQGKILWRNVQQIPLFLSPIATYIIVMEFIGKRKYTNHKLLALLSIPNLIYLALIFTDHEHHLMRDNIALRDHLGMRVTDIESTNFSNIFIAYNFFLLILSDVILIAYLRHSLEFYKTSHKILIIGLSLPVVYTLLQLFLPINLMSISTTYIPAGILIFYAMFRLKLFDIWPVAKDQIIENMSDGIVVIDYEHTLIDINPTAEEIIHKLTHKKPNNILGSPINEVLSNSELLDAYHAQKKHDFEMELNNKDQQEFYAVQIIPIFNNQNHPSGVLSIFSNITDRKKYEQELYKKAITDDLTGLFHRKHFISKATQYLKQYTNITVLLLDIDNFKCVNDKYGHDIGDSVLKEFASIVYNFIGDKGIISRFGGEEFAVLLPGINQEQSTIKAEQLRTIVEHHSVKLEHDAVMITVSIGIATKNNHKDTFESLYKQADKALYNSKHTGRNSISLG